MPCPGIQCERVSRDQVGAPRHQEGAHHRSHLLEARATHAQHQELFEFADNFRECDVDLTSLAESIDTSTPAGAINGVAHFVPVRRRQDDVRTLFEPDDETVNIIARTRTLLAMVGEVSEDTTVHPDELVRVPASYRGKEYRVRTDSPSRTQRAPRLLYKLILFVVFID